MSWKEFLEEFGKGHMRVYIDSTPEFDLLCEKLQEEGYDAGPSHTSIRSRAQANGHDYPYLGRVYKAMEAGCWAQSTSIIIVRASEIDMGETFENIINEAACLLEEL